MYNVPAMSLPEITDESKRYNYFVGLHADMTNNGSVVDFQGLKPRKLDTLEAFDREIGKIYEFAALSDRTEFEERMTDDEMLDFIKCFNSGGDLGNLPKRKGITLAEIRKGFKSAYVSAVWTDESCDMFIVVHTSEGEFELLF